MVMATTRAGSPLWLLATAMPNNGNIAPFPRWNRPSAPASTSRGLHSSSTFQPLAWSSPPLASSKPRAARWSMALAGINMTETTDSRPNAAASQKMAMKPNFQPSSPESPAPIMLPAWLKAWFRPFWRLKPFCRAIPRVIPATAGPIAGAAIAVATCDVAITQKL